MVGMTYPTLDRNILIASRVSEGESMNAVALDLGLTRERVRQICSRQSVVSKHSPDVVKARWISQFATWSADPLALPALANLPYTAKKLPGYEELAMLLATRRKQLRTRPLRLIQITNMQTLAEELGRTPRVREYVARFGGWRQDRWQSYNRLVTAAGLEPVPVGQHGHVTEQGGDDADTVPVPETITGERGTLAVEQALHRVAHA
jgi:hypothetical protein